MEARPSALAERVVAAFLPPDRRDEILGDLHERYVSPRHYAADAATVVPCVLFSHLRMRWSRRARIAVAQTTRIGVGLQQRSVVAIGWLDVALLSVALAVWIPVRFRGVPLALATLTRWTTR
jgi:hypothetical protein